MNKKEISRRDLVKLGLAGAAVSALPVPLWAQSGPVTHVIPSSGEKIPVIGVGTNSFNLGLQDQLTEMIAGLVKQGGKVIDTAAAYGESEQTIGNILAQTKLRDQVFISTKLTAGGGMGGSPPGAGMNQGGQPPMGGGNPGQGAMAGGGRPPMDRVGGKESFERSLERLQTASIDLLMVHNMNGLEELMPQLQDWKKAGLIRYLGTTTSNSRQHTAMMEAMETYDFDFVQVNYSLGDRTAEEGVLPLARKKGVATMINVPFGGRGGRTLSEVLSEPLPDWAADIGATSWAQILLKYVVSHPDVTVAIPGSTKLNHLLDNQQAATGPMPDQAMRQRIAAYWDSMA